MISILDIMINYKPIITSIIYLFISIAYSNAQSVDSIQFVNTKWTETKLKKGIVWKKAQFTNLFNSNQVINLVEIELSKNNLKKLGLEALPKERKKTSYLADSLNALVAINGGFFDMKNGGAVDYIKSKNRVLNTSHAKGERANAYLAFDGHNLIITKDSSLTKKYSEVILSGPYLVHDHTIVALKKNAFNDNRHPRTAIALKNNKLILLTVDGRHNQSQGLNLQELSQLFKWYNCHSAMNLDGGGSTAMYIRGQGDKGIVNYPSDNKKFDHQGERSVANIIFIK